MSAKKIQTTLEFPDNKLLAALGGAHGKHFARLEQVLGVHLASRGNLVAVEGAGRERAAAILKSLYARLKAGESITLAEVDAELRFTEAGRDAAGDEGRGGAIRTASGRVTRPRTPAQAAYLEQMRGHPLVFGIGPAGTGKTYLAVAMAAAAWNAKKVSRIILVRPAVEEAILRGLGQSGRHNGDTLLGMLCDAQLADAQRHRRWTAALVQMALTQDGNQEVLKGWIAKWEPLADAAIDAYCAALPDAPDAGSQARSAVRALRNSLGV